MARLTRSQHDALYNADFMRDTLAQTSATLAEALGVHASTVRRYRRQHGLRSRLAPGGCQRCVDYQWCSTHRHADRLRCEVG